MNHEMRRARQALSLEECEKILARGTSGTLALIDAQGEPYAVPMSYAYVDGTLLFHCAKAGRKLDALRHNPRASFCVIDADDIVPEEFTTYFKSVIVSGEMRIIEDEPSIRAACVKLADRFYPDHPVERDKEIDHLAGHMYMLELVPDAIAGKQAKELVGKSE